MGKENDAEDTKLIALQTVYNTESTQFLSVRKMMSKCLEEIGLEGRSGAPVHEIFDRIDPAMDLAYREYLWSILRGLRKELTFFLFHDQGLCSDTQKKQKSKSSNKKSGTFIDEVAKNSTSKAKEAQNDLVSEDQNSMMISDVSSLSYVQVSEESKNSGLRVVACEELRLKYLGVVNPASIDTSSTVFDLLEVIGQTRIQGKNAADLTSVKFGDARRVHYLLDVLIGLKLIEKNIVQLKSKRFNIVHLTRFAKYFHPSMVSKEANLEREGLQKDQLPALIAQIMKSRGERTCVFADIGRELGYNKRQQEQIRRHFVHEASVNNNFPLELFLARCSTASDLQGRKLWCIRLRDDVTQEEKGFKGTVIERGIMEQFYATIQDCRDGGATIPEIRDILGVPSFKLPYKLAQGLISNYDLKVEQVVEGKNTMYRMFAPPPVQNLAVENIVPSSDGLMENQIEDSTAHVEDVTHKDDANDPFARAHFDARISLDEKPVSPSKSSARNSSLKQVAQKILTASTFDRRKKYILERLNQEEIVCLSRLRMGLCKIERSNPKSGIDMRSIYRITDELEQNGSLITMHINLPPKKALQKTDRMIKCIALPSAKNDKRTIQNFIDRYYETWYKQFDQSVEEDSFVVVTGRSSKYMSAEERLKEIVKYKAAAYKTARANMTKVFHQSKKLGYYFGTMYRARTLHLLLWERADKLMKSRVYTQDTNPANSNEGDDILFSLADALDIFTVQEFIHLAGINEPLTEEEEACVTLAARNNESWQGLSREIVKKIRGCEFQRFTRILRIMLDLKLLDVMDDFGTEAHEKLLRVFNSAMEFDEAVSRVAFSAIAGGVFKLKRKANIRIRLGNKVISKLPTKGSYVYASSFFSKSKAEFLPGKVPLEYSFDDMQQVKDYWKALKFLSLEGAFLNRDSSKKDTVTIQVDSDRVWAAPVKGHSIDSMKLWVPKGMSNSSTQQKSDRAAQASSKVGRSQALLQVRKRFSNKPLNQRFPKKRKTTNQLQVEDAQLPHFVTKRSVESSVVAGMGKKSLRVTLWTPEQDAKLIELYLEKLTYCWFIMIPAPFQKRDERIGFRNTSLSRTNISWKEIGSELKKTHNDCVLRVKELLQVPHFLYRLEDAKTAVTQMNNPGGIFHEEEEIKKSPTLTALLIRALQIVFHSNATYYSVLADTLISQWKEREVKLIWRYMWLNSSITRPRSTDSENQKHRGFCAHSHIYEMKSLQISQYPMKMFDEAAEYLNFLKENIVEANVDDEEEPESKVYYEHEVPINASAGHSAVQLSLMAMGASELIPEYNPITEEERQSMRVSDDRNSKGTPVLKGFAGHIARCYHRSAPDDFLKYYWGLKGRTNVEFAHSNQQQLSQVVESLHAFSTIPQYEMRVIQVCEEMIGKKRSRFEEEDTLQSPAALSEWVQDALKNAAQNGLSLNDLLDKWSALSSKDKIQKTKSGHRKTYEREERKMRLLDSLHQLITSELVLEVNGYFEPRYVAREFSGIWVLKPYHVQNNLDKGDVKFVFDTRKPIVARPWLHLDGSPNVATALALKRKVTNIVMCCPGIRDDVLHRKMRRVVSLQDVRNLLEELIRDDVIYARAARKESQRKLSLFCRTKKSDFALFVVKPSDLNILDYARENLHYFPSVNCVEMFGMTAHDAEL